MIKVLYGEKGTGKTKVLVDTANDLASRGSGDVVFIDDSNQLMYDLKHEIRFINVSEYPVKEAPEFLGFLYGIIAQDYDLEGIFIDGLTYILNQKIEELENFFKSLKTISERYNVKIYVSINGKSTIIPMFMKEFIE